MVNDASWSRVLRQRQPNKNIKPRGSAYESFTVLSGWLLAASIPVCSPNHFFHSDDYDNKYNHNKTESLGAKPASTAAKPARLTKPARGDVNSQAGCYNHVCSCRRHKPGPTASQFVMLAAIPADLAKGES